MTNAELIAALRYCKADSRCGVCEWYKYCESRKRNNESCLEQLHDDAAAALEAAEKRIAELEKQMPKEGEWIEDDATYCGADLSNYKCSLCGKIGGTWRRGLKQDELPPFCGSCGARMKGGQE